MKFALIAAAYAIRMTARSTENWPTAAEVLQHCDTNGNGVINSTEFVNCFTPVA